MSLLHFAGFLYLILAFLNNESNSEVLKTKLRAGEKQALEKFRPMVKNLLYREYMNEDYYLINFLRAKEMQMEPAAEMVQQAHKWRRDNKIDGIMDEDMTKLQKNFRYYADGVDYEGRPVISWDYGRWDIRRMSLSGSMPMLIRYLDRILEQGLIQIREQRNVTGKDVTQHVIIIDGYGFSARTHACVTCLPFYFSFITHSDQYYPQTGHAVHMINIPRVFDNVYSLMRPIMSPQVRDIVKLYGFDSSDWKKIFSKTIPLNQIRKQFGGTRENTFE